jgi:hypothetical protein
VEERGEGREEADFEVEERFFEAGHAGRMMGDALFSGGRCVFDFR